MNTIAKTNLRGNDPLWRGGQGAETEAETDHGGVLLAEDCSPWLSRLPFTQRRPTCTRMAANNGLGLSPADIAIGQSDGRNSLRFLPFSQVTKTNHTLCNCYTHSTKSIFQFPTWLINPETYRLFLIALALTKLRNLLHTQSALHTPQPSPWSPLPIHIILVHKIPSLGPTARGTQSKSPFFKLFGPCLSP